MAATDVVWKALAETIPSRLAAGHFCTANSTLLVLEGSGQPSYAARQRGVRTRGRFHNSLS